MLGKLPVQRTPEEDEEWALKSQERFEQTGISSRVSAIRITTRAATGANLERTEQTIPLRLPEYEDPSAQEFERMVPTLIVLLETEPITKEMSTRHGICQIDKLIR